MCGSRTPRVVSKTPQIPPLFTVRNVIIRHRGFLELDEYRVDGIRIPGIEIVHYPAVAVVVPFDSQEKIVYMVEQPRFAAWMEKNIQPRADGRGTEPEKLVGRTILWNEICVVGFPSGRMEAGVPSLAALARQELLEEAGFDRPESEFIFCGKWLVSPGNSDETITVYLVMVSGQPEPPSGDGSEDIRVWAVPLESLDEFLAERTVGLATALGVRLLRERL